MIFVYKASFLVSRSDQFLLNENFLYCSTDPVA